MIRHVSIPARDPQRVATALAEIIGGRVFAFTPLPGGFMVVSGDAHGTMIEIYPDGVQLAPEDGIFRTTSPAAYHPFHVLISVPAAREDIERVGEREGWQTDFCTAGAPGRPPAFHLYRMWVENRLLVEFVTESMAAEYESYYAQFEGFDAPARGRAATTA